MSRTCPRCKGKVTHEFTGKVDKFECQGCGRLVEQRGEGETWALEPMDTPDPVWGPLFRMVELDGPEFEPDKEG